jgi:phosphate transport system protein
MAKRQERAPPDVGLLDMQCDLLVLVARVLQPKAKTDPAAGRDLVSTGLQRKPQPAAPGAAGSKGEQGVGHERAHAPSGSYPSDGLLCIYGETGGQGSSPLASHRDPMVRTVPTVPDGGVEAELGILHDDVLAMGHLARLMLHDGAKALTGADTRLAVGVLEQAAVLASMDESLEMRLLEVIARGKASPTQVQWAGALLKVISYLNRIGRYGHDIARTVTQGAEVRRQAVLRDGLSGMMGRVQDMLDVVLDALASRLAPPIDVLLDLEDAVDAAHVRVLEDATRLWHDGQGDAGAIVHGILASRALERCADNVCKIGEKLHYAATGERVLLR